MGRFVWARLLRGVLTLFAVSLMVFFIPRVAGSPLDLLMPIEATQEQYRIAEIRLGLDRPLYVQYGLFVLNAVRGDLGNSIRMSIPVNRLIGERLPNSVALAAVAMAMSLSIAIPLGILSAVKKGTLVDTLSRTVAVLGQSIPQFWLGLMLILVFSLHFDFFPAFGKENWRSYLLPGFTLGAGIVTAGIMRLLRSSMIDVLDSEYTKLARIKGVPESAVIWKHALRNAIMPVITFGGIYFSLLVGLAVVVETVFVWPGIGRLSYEAIIWKDYPIIQGVILVVSIIVMVVNLLVDILYAFVDPRVRYD